MIATALALRLGYAPASEKVELIFIVLAGAVGGVILEFAIRLLFVTPAKLYRELEDKSYNESEELKKQLKTASDDVQRFKEQTTRPLGIEPNVSVPYLFFDATPDQLILAEKNNLAACCFEIHNPNPTQTVSGVELRLLKLEPPMENATVDEHFKFVEGLYPKDIPKPIRAGLSSDSTDYCDLSSLKFPIPDLNGDQSRRVGIFTAERREHGVIIKFDCDWPGRMPNKFNAKGEHFLEVEASAKGLQSKIVRFKLSFVLNPKQIPDKENPNVTKSEWPVFTIEKIAEDKLWDFKQRAKDVLAVDLRDLHWRLQETKGVFRLDFKDDLKAKEWDKTWKLLDKIESHIKVYLTETEASLFYIATPTPLDPTDKNTDSLDYLWHENTLTIKLDELKKIVNKLG